MTSLHVLDELDRVQRLLEEEFPECKIGYAYRPEGDAHRVRHGSQRWPSLRVRFLAWLRAKCSYWRSAASP